MTITTFAMQEQYLNLPRISGLYEVGIAKAIDFVDELLPDGLKGSLIIIERVRDERVFRDLIRMMVKYPGLDHTIVVMQVPLFIGDICIFERLARFLLEGFMVAKG